MLSSFARNQFNKPMPDPSGARVSLALTRFLHSQLIGVSVRIWFNY